MSCVLSYARANSLLKYDPITGIIKWVANPSSRSRVAIGNEAGCIQKSTGYRHICVDGKLYKSHRVAFLLHTGSWPKKHIDHINHVKDDNRWINLREVDHRGNCMNRSISCVNTSGVVGVGWHKHLKRWYASIKVNGKDYHIGYFDNKDDAARARKIYEKKYGFHRNHGAKHNG